MRFINLGNIPLSRKKYSDFHTVNVDPTIGVEDDVSIALTDEGIEVTHKRSLEREDQEYKHESSRRPKGYFISDVEPGFSGGLFNHGRELDEEPLIWIATRTVLVANNTDVQMGIIHLDEGLLVCLQKGAIQVQSTDDGDTITLTRGIAGVSDDQRYMSATNESFKGLPDYAHDAVLNITLHRGIKKLKEGGFRYLDIKARVHTESSALLDRGYRFEKEEEERLAEAKRIQEDTDRKNEEAKEAMKLRAEDERDEIADSFGGTKHKSRTTRKSSKPAEDSSTSRNMSAAAFFESQIGSRG